MKHAVIWALGTARVDVHKSGVLWRRVKRARHVLKILAAMRKVSTLEMAIILMETNPVARCMDCQGDL